MVTKAEKANRMKNILRELLQERTYKWNEILEASAKIYEDRYPGETPDANTLKGKIGSVLSLMEDGGEMRFEAGICSWIRPVVGKPEETASLSPSEGKASGPAPAIAAATDAKPAPEKKSSKGKKEPAKKADEAKKEEKAGEKKPEKKPAAPKKRAAAEKKAAAVPAQTPGEEAAQSQNPETHAPASSEEKPAVKKRGRKPKAAETAEETQAVEGAAPKRRGRKPKAIVLPTPAAPEEASSRPAALEEPENAPLPKRLLFDSARETAVREPVKAENVPPRAETTENAPPSAAETAAAASGGEAPLTLEKTTEKPVEKAPEPERREKKENALTVKPEAKVAPVFDMTLLLGGKKPGAGKKEPASEGKASAPVGAKPASAADKPASSAVSGPAAAENHPSSAASPVLSAEKSVSPPATDKASADPSRSVAAASAEQKGETNVLAAVLNAREPKKAALPEFAFLGNAAAKPAADGGKSVAASQVSRGGAAQALKEKEPVRTPETQSGGANAVGVRGGGAAGAKANGGNADKLRQQPAAKAQPASAVSPAPSSQPGRGKAPTEQAVKPAESGQNGAGAPSNGRRGAHRGRGRTPAALPETPEGILKTEFLKRLRSLGGDYFEYYSVYLLERYSLKNGRRLEGMRVSGGERDGGIDGEIELTDKFGFRETIYIQSKNWDPSKGDLDKWVVGETLLQQFIGAVACRQAKEGKRHSRGIFITTSHFTPEARELLETMSDNFIGYDEDDVFEAAKECRFGLIEKDGEWQLDEALLSGGKAFFNLL